MEWYTFSINLWHNCLFKRGQACLTSASDASKTGKITNALFKDWSTAIVAVGQEKIVQLVTDGEQANRAADRLLEERYPHIIFFICMVHCLNNFPKDLSTILWVAKTNEKGSHIVFFIYKHPSMLAELGESNEVLERASQVFGYASWIQLFDDEVNTQVL